MKPKKLKDNQFVYIGNTVLFTCCDCGLRHKFTFQNMQFKVKRQNHFKGLPKRLYETTKDN